VLTSDNVQVGKIAWDPNGRPAKLIGALQSHQVERRILATEAHHLPGKRAKLGAVPVLDACHRRDRETCPLDGYFTTKSYARPELPGGWPDSFAGAPGPRRRPRPAWRQPLADRPDHERGAWSPGPPPWSPSAPTPTTLSAPNLQRVVKPDVRLRPRCPRSSNVQSIVVKPNGVP